MKHAGAMIVGMMVLLVLPHAPSLAQEVDSAQERAFDFADACFIRGEYELAADGYAKYLEQYADGAYRAEATYRLGESEYQRRRMDQAARAFAEYARAYPTGEHATRANFRLGEIAYKEGRHQDALEPLLAAASQAREPVIAEAAHYFLGATQAALRRWDGARQALRSAMEVEASDLYHTVAGVTLVDVLLELNDTATARATLAQLAALPSDKAGHGGTALGDRHLLRMAGQAGRAQDDALVVTLYRRMLADFPQSAFRDPAALGLVSALYNARDYEAAVKQGQAVQADYGDPAAAAENRFLVGTALYELGRFADAASTLRPLADDPATPERLRRRVDYRLVWCGFQTGDMQAVVSHGRPYVADAPTDATETADIHYLLGQAFITLDQPGEAETHFDLVLQGFPNAPYAADALLQLGYSRLLRKRHEAAAQDLRRFIERHPSHEQIHVARRYLAEALVGQEDFEGAAPVFEQAIAAAQAANATQEVADLYLNLAACHYQLRDFATLAQTYESMLAVAPNHPRRSEALYWIGYHLQTQEQYAPAIEHLEQVVAEPGELPANQLDDAHLRLVVAHYELDDSTAATQAMMVLLRRPSARPPQELVAWAAENLRETQEWEQADYVYERLADLYPLEDVLATSYVERGYSRLALNKPQAALELFEVFFAEVDMPAWRQRAHLGRAQALAALNRCDEAVLSFEQAELTGDDPEALAQADLGRAECLEQELRWEDAYSAYLRVWALYDMEPECPQAAAGCLRAAQALGDDERVERIRKELLERYPDSPQAKALAGS